MDGKLTGTTVGEAAKIQQWLLFADNELWTNFADVIYPILGLRTYDAERSKLAEEKAKRAVGVLETVLKEQPFLVNDHVTLADICVSTALVWPLKTVVDKAYREQYPAVTKWLASLFALPEFKKVLGDVEYVDVALKPKECQA
jgi:elongation factor 1-gamma